MKDLNEFSLDFYSLSGGFGSEGVLVRGEIKCNLNQKEVYAEFDLSPEGFSSSEIVREVELYKNGDEIYARVNDGSIEYVDPECGSQDSDEIICGLADPEEAKELTITTDFQLPYDDLEEFLDNVQHAFRETASSDYEEHDSKSHKYRLDVVDLVEGEFGEELLEEGAYDFESNIGIDQSTGVINHFDLRYRTEPDAAQNIHTNSLFREEDYNDLEPAWLPQARSQSD